MKCHSCLTACKGGRISYFSCVCDQIPNEKQLQEGNFYCLIAWKDCPSCGEGMARGACSLPGGQEADKGVPVIMGLSPFLIRSRTLSHWMVLLMSPCLMSPCLSSLVSFNPSKTYPSYVSSVILNPVHLTVINHHRDRGKRAWFILCHWSGGSQRKSMTLAIWLTSRPLQVG